MRYPQIISAFLSTPWALLPSKLEEIRAFLTLKASGGDVDPAEIEALGARTRTDGVQMAGRVAILPVMGVISQRVGMMERASGGVSTEEIGAALDSLAADKAVKAIVMAFDSPGGSVYGISELATKIRATRDRKRVVALADSVAASAAYWIASQASELVVTPGGQVGSVGILAAHQDVSKAEEMLGVKTTIISSTPEKVELASEFPLSVEARAELQSKVNHYYGMFIADIAKGRGITEAKVRADFGQGRMLTAKDAVAAGMADRVATLDQVVRRLDPEGASAGTNGRPLSAVLAGYRARAVEVGR